MCGIAGIIRGERGATVDEQVVRRMCDAIIHRGPDEEGIRVEGGVGLGMRRLSIIDLATGQQPIHNEDRTVWIVFNGEIYNFPELRPKLLERGHQLYTKSDTEVIVHLYEEYGAECVQHLRGMFAFALYDQRRRRLLLARDRLGKKPLHYALRNGTFYFGSEIKSLVAVAPELAEIDQHALLDYFYFGYIPDPRTAFVPIRKLPPGHVLEFEDGRIDVRRYWDLPAFGSEAPRSEEECLDEFETRLADAVRMRLISEVPLGALLSGGVDSSTVVALMARAASGPVKTFSIGFRHADFNEADYARLVAERYGTEHHELLLEPRVGETLDKLTRMMEEPFSDSSMLPTYYVSCLAREHVTVALAGDGGDELFAGYDRYLVNLRRQKFDVFPPALGRLYRKWIYPRLPAGLRGRKFSYNISLPPVERYLDGLTFFAVDGRDTPIFAGDFLEFAQRSPSPLELFRSYLSDAPATDHLSRLLYLDTKTYLTADILAKVDRMSMATSLEVRAPLLDHEIVEWVARLPVEYKYRNGRRKYLLKRLAERLGVPRELLDRPKQGFAIPLVHWMRNELKSPLQDVLLDRQTLERGYFRREAVEDILNEHFRGRRDRSGVLWMLLIFEMWHRNFLEALRGLPSSTSRSLPQTVRSHPAGSVLEPEAAGPSPEKFGS